MRRDLRILMIMMMMMMMMMVIASLQNAQNIQEKAMLVVHTGAASLPNDKEAHIQR